MEGSQRKELQCFLDIAVRCVFKFLIFLSFFLCFFHFLKIKGWLHLEYRVKKEIATLIVGTLQISNEDKDFTLMAAI